MNMGWKQEPFYVISPLIQTLLPLCVAWGGHRGCCSIDPLGCQVPGRPGAAGTPALVPLGHQQPRLFASVCLCIFPLTCMPDREEFGREYSNQQGQPAKNSNNNLIHKRKHRNKMVWERHVRNVKKWVMIPQFYKTQEKTFVQTPRAGLLWKVWGPLLPEAMDFLCSDRGEGNQRASDPVKCSHFYLLASVFLFLAINSLRIIFNWSFSLTHLYANQVTVSMLIILQNKQMR